MKFAKLALGLLLFASLARAQTVPEWIWHPNDGAKPGDDEVRYFRKTFKVEGGKPVRGTLSVDADINGEKIGEGSGWQQYHRYDIARNVMERQNIVAIQGRNEGSAAGLLVEMDVRVDDGSRELIVSDASWQAGTTADSSWQNLAFQPQSKWVPARSLGKMGVAPWGNIEVAAAAPAGRRRTDQSGGKAATAAESLTVLDGFKVELLRSAQAGEGSWVAMAFDPMVT